MVTFEEVLNELVSKTRGGGLLWTAMHESRYWFANHGNCRFTVLTDNYDRLYVLIFNLEGGNHTWQLGSGVDVEPLVNVLMEMYPFDGFSQQEALQAALDSLRQI